MGSEPAQGKMLAAALNFARHNIPVFPCGPDKRPRTKHGFKDATTDERQIQLWWTQWPDAMIGIPTGATSGIIVIDIDVDHEKGIDGTKWVVEVKHQHGDFPIGSRARTPRGGLHLYFKAPATQIRSSAGKIAEGVDVRAEGGYVIAPPSASSVGGYKWIKSIFEEGASGIPDFLLKILIEAHSSGQSSDLSDEQLIEEEIAAAVSDIRSAKDGTRNATLNRSAFKIGRLIGAGVCEEDDVRRRLQEAAEGAGLSPEEVCRTIESGVRAGKKRPWKPTSTDKVLNELNQNHFFALEGKNSFVFREDIDPLFRRATLTHLYPGAFRDAFRNVKVACGKTRSKSAGEAWLEWPQRRQYDKVVFAPGQEMGPSIYNTWQGHAVEAIKG
ncbi:MAG: hypothetical protein FJX42_05615, partial [Alphaproteobacteria bacterium]|nr:hypothetical protein [Alphaproteobacteria bacterium]